MRLKKSKRTRGVLLTPQGLRKLLKGKRELEELENIGHKYTLEELGERAGLSSRTITAVMSCQNRVDRRTLSVLFMIFDIELEENDYSYDVAD
jgi:hypothetical protein